MSSKERLDMDNVKNNSHPSFKEKKGIFMQRWMLLTLIAVVLVCVIIVGLLVGYLTPCRYGLKASNLIDDQSEIIHKKQHPYSMLPRSVVPEHYHIELQPFIIPDNFTFKGFVKIIVKILEETDNITFHINEITIQENTIKLRHTLGESVPKIKFTSPDKEREFFILHLGGKLKAHNQYEIEMSYTGTLNDQLSGFYRSSYKDSEGNTRWLATTQFQPTDARKAFPCFDEPALKAKFNITIIRWKNMTSISNMPLANTISKDDEWDIDTFEESVRMSTYLVAFVVSDFKRSGTTENFSIWSRETAINTTEYAAKIGPEILKFYEDFFDVKFPLPKMDMIAVPDFSAGAMENWGLIIYRETALLYDPNIASIGNKQRVATVVSHELAHQWFGNLVTPKWWDDLWLNEGFASYVEYLGVEAVEPEWMMDQQFVIDDLQDVMELDCLKTSHPISVPVGHPDEINEIFDRISYGKGASLIRMMRFFLGNETFKKGLSKYLNDKKFQNAVQDDLWEHLTAAQDTNDRIDVKTVMDSWTLQTGYPVVTITRDYTEGKATVNQTRFLLEQGANGDKSKWEIPFTYTDGLNPNWDIRTKWLHKKDGEINNLPGPDDWIIGNVQQVGYYKVNYDEQNWKALIRQLDTDHQKIHIINRAQILDDSLDLARSGLLNYDLSLNATLYLNKEQEYLPWKSALDSFSYIDSMLSRTEIYGKWKKYIIKQISPLYTSLGWAERADDSILKQYLRTNVLAWLCGYEHEDCTKQANSLFKTFMENSTNVNTIKPNFRSVVYCTAVRHGGEKVWNFIWNRYLVAEVASEKNKLMFALACAREPWLLSRYLDWSLSPNSGIRRQDGSSIFRATGSKLYGRDLAFNYVRDKWNKIFAIYGKGTFAIGNLIKAVASSLNTPFDLQQFKDFYKKNRNNTGSATRSFQQSIENAEANVKWMKTNFNDIKNWLDSVNLTNN